MSKFKGTPGPWKVRKWSGDEWPDRRISVGPESDGIATAVCISPRYCSETQAEVNARLIAAAPELLEALRYAVDVLEDLDMNLLHNVVENGKAAIAKALGEDQQ